jgi:hypothetical protein
MGTKRIDLLGVWGSNNEPQQCDTLIAKRPRYCPVSCLPVAEQELRHILQHVIKVSLGKRIQVSRKILYRSCKKSMDLYTIATKNK